MALPVQSVPLRYIPIHSLGKLHAVSAFYPSYGGSRLVSSRSAPHRVVTIRVRPSVVIRELDRIEHKVRPSVGYSASEDFLCSNTSKDWEDESRKIRAQTNALLQKVYNPVPRASSVVPCNTIARYERYESNLPSRFSCDNYIKNMVMPVRNVARDIISMSWYAEPAKKFTGRGHLACVKYSGAKGYPTRRAICPDFTVKDDVTLLSFYVKNRLAALGLSLDATTVKLLPDRPSRRFLPPALMEDPAIELKAAKAERLERFKAVDAAPIDNAAEAERLAERKKKRQEEAKQAEERALAEEQAKKKASAKRSEESRAAELARQEELAAQAAAERAAELERKAEITKKAEQEKKAAEDAAKRAEEETKKAEASKLAEAARIAEEARQAEEARLAEEARVAEEARLAEEARIAEEARVAEEAKKAAEEVQRQKEIARLSEIASQEEEAELARQAAELVEIARQEAELAALAKQEAELAELQKQEESAAAEEAAAAVESEATTEEAEAEPIVEEPQTPDAQNDEDVAIAEEAPEAADGDATEEEEE